MTQEEFISKSIEKYGDRFSYDKVEFKNLKTNVCIICNNKDSYGEKHGSFLVEPSYFLNRDYKCPKCNNVFKYDCESFIKESKKIHFNKYDYSKAICESCKSKVIIICPEHGEFVKEARFHIKGEGCPICSRQNKRNGVKNAESFIKEANKKHNNKYDYSKVKYVNSQTKVCIICPEHGEFWQTPASHLNGRGCNKCSKPIYDTKSFISYANKKHNNKYDYSKVKYVNSQTKVCIICPEHGEFWMTPNNHTQKRKKGCPKCAIIKAHKKQALTTEEFIKKAKEVHNNKYDYSKVNYVNNRTNICIICPEHGEFWQLPTKHLIGHGCLKCRFSHLEREVEQILNDIKIEYIYQANKKTLPWLGNQTLDFYIPKYKIAIECQGEQHYQPVRWGSKNVRECDVIKNFKKIKRNDILKYNKCLKNNCKIIYFTKEVFANNGEFYDVKNIKQYFDAITSIDEGTLVERE